MLTTNEQISPPSLHYEFFFRICTVCASVFFLLYCISNLSMKTSHIYNFKVRLDDEIYFSEFSIKITLDEKLLFNILA